MKVNIKYNIKVNNNLNNMKNYTYFNRCFITAFRLHLSMNDVQFGHIYTNVRGTYVNSMFKIGRCSNH